MRHVPDGTLRRIIDEPFAVADRVLRHVESCPRCQARSESIGADATAAQRLFDHRLLADGTKGYARLRAVSFAKTPDRQLLRVNRRRSWRLIGTPLSTGVTVATVGVVVAGVAAAATLTTVFAPTQVVPVPISQADLQQFSQLTGLDSSISLGGFSKPSGSETLPFGALTWTSSGGPKQVGSLADAKQATGLSVSLPPALPNGIGGVARYVVMSKVTAAITFDSNAGSELSGSSLVVTLGPAIDVSYSGSTGGGAIDPLGILTVAQPIATSTGATENQIENFLLSRPGVPADLAEEIRLLGNLQNTLPIPTPPGVSSESTKIDGSSAVVLTDGSNTASAAIWEQRDGVIHAVAGLLDKQDLLNVAQQIG